MLLFEALCADSKPRYVCNLFTGVGSNRCSRQTPVKGLLNPAGVGELTCYMSGMSLCDFGLRNLMSTHLLVFSSVMISITTLGRHQIPYHIMPASVLNLASCPNSLFLNVSVYTYITRIFTVLRKVRVFMCNYTTYLARFGVCLRTRGVVRGGIGSESRACRGFLP